MKIIKLENLIYLGILLLPTYLIRLELFGVPFNFLEILIATILIWSLLIIPKEKWLEKTTTSYLIIFGFILLGLTISTVLNGNYKQGAGIIKSWFLLPFLFGLVVNKYISEEKRINIFISYLFSAFFVACISLIYFILGKVTYDGRLEFLFNSPNYLAMYLSPAVIVGFVLLSSKKINEPNLFFKFKLKKEVILILLLIVGSCLCLTYSLSAWVALAIILLGLLLFRIKKIKKFLISSISLLVLLILVQINISKINDPAVFDDRSSFSSRIMIWESTEKILEDNWLFGIGPGNFQEEYLLYQRYFPPYLEWAVPHPHNILLSFWLYGGVISFLGFLVLIIFWLRECMLKKQKDDVFLIALGIMAYIFIHGLVDTTYFKNDLSIVFWITFFSL